MAGIDTYPTGTPGVGDLVPYVEDPAGTPALKLADAAGFGGGGGFAVDSVNGASTLIVTGLTETVIATVDKPATSALLIAAAAFSMNQYGSFKAVTFRIRRDDVAGAVVWETATSAGADDVSGASLSVFALVGDDAATGTWVLTAQITTGTSSTDLWSTRWVLAAIA